MSYPRSKFLKQTEQYRVPLRRNNAWTSQMDSELIGEVSVWKLLNSISGSKYIILKCTLPQFCIFLYAARVAISLDVLTLLSIIPTQIVSKTISKKILIGEFYAKLPLNLIEENKVYRQALLKPSRTRPSSTMMPNTWILSRQHMWFLFTWLYFRMLWTMMLYIIIKSWLDHCEWAAFL